MKTFASVAALAAWLLTVPTSPVRADPEAVTVRPAPALGPGVWVSGAPTTIAAQRGRVTVLLFWTRGCINCKHNLGFWNDWARTYHNADVSVLSVHTPETPGERSVPSVRRFVRSWPIQFPVLTDNSEQTWDAYGVTYWPSEVLIDKKGRIRYIYDGELNYDGSGEYKTVQAMIEKLRAEKTTGRTVARA